MKKFFMILIFFAFFLDSNGFSVNNKTIKIINWNKDNFALKYLRLQNFSFEIDQNNVIFIKRSKKNQDCLIKLLRILQKKIKIIKENIKNYDTACYEKKYRRKFIIIDSKGKVLIAEDTQKPFRLIYNPSHPAAIKEGTKKGYVEYTNIILEKEFYDLIETIKVHNEIVQILQKLDQNIILNTIDLQEVNYLWFNLLNQELRALKIMFNIDLKNKLENNLLHFKNKLPKDERKKFERDIKKVIKEILGK